MFCTGGLSPIIHRRIAAGKDCNPTDRYRPSKKFCHHRLSIPSLSANLHGHSTCEKMLGVLWLSCVDQWRLSKIRLKFIKEKSFKVGSRQDVLTFLLKVWLQRQSVFLKWLYWERWNNLKPSSNFIFWKTHETRENFSYPLWTICCVRTIFNVLCATSFLEKPTSGRHC